MKVAKGLILKILITGKTNFVTIYRWILTRVFVVILPNVQILNNYAICVCALVAQSCPTLCYPVDYSLPGSSVHGILHARILEWVPISFSRGSSQHRDWTGSLALQADSLPFEPTGKLLLCYIPENNVTWKYTSITKSITKRKISVSKAIL